ncbi:response regulator transcription factor [Amycolatopsis taiwanensis]|uniref:DNA-binding response regulator n=1 Tax=Amycolatopsis taiwanensis TaxID=342230 RepID=A0A9W6QY94_9PSEU|nr:response regulator transcription factor [Amycolatopsis taiwanensis]GLY64738.1 DNA-binding response regulator [Amycolatopsis taiwanensis]
MTISIVLCLTDTLSSAGIEALLRDRDGLKVVDVRPSTRSALEVVRSHGPDLVLGDRDLAESTDVAEIARLSKIIVISGGEGPDESARWLARGISAVLDEQTTPDVLFSAVEVVVGGSYLVVPSALALRLAQPAEDVPTRSRYLESVLTQREAEVLRLLADGLSNMDIARRMLVSDTTIRSHVHHMMRKLGVSSRTQAVSVAYRTGLLSPARNQEG